MSENLNSDQLLEEIKRLGSRVTWIEITKVWPNGSPPGESYERIAAHLETRTGTCVVEGHTLREALERARQVAARPEYLASTTRIT